MRLLIFICGIWICTMASIVCADNFCFDNTFPGHEALRGTWIEANNMHAFNGSVHYGIPEVPHPLFAYIVDDYLGYVGYYDVFIYLFNNQYHNILSDHVAYVLCDGWGHHHTIVDQSIPENRIVYAGRFNFTYGPSQGMYLEMIDENRYAYTDATFWIWVGPNSSDALPFEPGTSIPLNEIDQIENGGEWMLEALSNRDGFTSASGELAEPTITVQPMCSVYPNPFNQQTSLSFTLPEPERITLRILDIQGREVAVIEKGMIPAGTQTYTWDGRDLASGIYFAQLVAGNDSVVRRLTLVK